MLQYDTVEPGTLQLLKRKRIAFIVAAVFIISGCGLSRPRQDKSIERIDARYEIKQKIKKEEITTGMSVITGHVLNVKTRIPLFAIIEVVDRNYKKIAGTTTDSSGFFKLEVPTGNYEIFATSAGFLKFHKKLEALKSMEYLDVTIYPGILNFNCR